MGRTWICRKTSVKTFVSLHSIRARIGFLYVGRVRCTMDRWALGGCLDLFDSSYNREPATCKSAVYSSKAERLKYTQACLTENPFDTCKFMSCWNSPRMHSKLLPSVTRCPSGTLVIRAQRLQCTPLKLRIRLSKASQSFSRHAETQRSRRPYVGRCLHRTVRTVTSCPEGLSTSPGDRRHTKLRKMRKALRQWIVEGTLYS
jgi:hypothetical protein